MRSKNKVELEEALTTSVLSSPSSIKVQQWCIGENLSVAAEEAFTCIERGPEEKRQKQRKKARRVKDPSESLEDCLCWAASRTSRRYLKDLIRILELSPRGKSSNYQGIMFGDVCVVFGQ
eukprot:TRINITY_DN9184_c0_g1_i1.p2 TRINITY_DN9184_c0_g1~~TRINITY_DN9184_c0_g1_i1.p2  ORF type:complete len:120 (-),score=12.10 TRINITY_DN9184_c0_g1_i1:114-473(-)